MAPNDNDIRGTDAPLSAGSHGLREIAVRSEGSEAVLLQQASGAPAARRRDRRGSFLVLVIGVLALISAFMVIYVAVGRADQQLSSAVARSSVGLSDSPDGRSGSSYRDSVAEKFAKYASQVIADDALATFYNNKSEEAVRSDGISIANTIRLTREASDYPYTDWNRNSDALIGVDPGKFFDPIGTFRTDMNVNDAPDVWRASDPWLASTEPVWLNHPATAGANWEDEFLYRKDWGQISNLAPDGVFVNLWNMRGLPADYVGSFDADHAQMRAKLSLTDDTGKPTTKLDFGGNSDVKIPAHWTMRQRGAAVPVGTETVLPSSQFYRPYQWADADGDGIYDSRWFEMVDPRVNPTTYDLASPTDVLGIGGGDLRYFFAARVVDLSGSVNVNTAGDFVSPPSSDGKYPVGATPADVDLRRLLALEDVWRAEGFAYDALAQSDNTNDDNRPQNYLGYTNTPSPLTSLIGNRAFLSIGYTINRGTIAALRDVNISNPQERFGKDDDKTNGAKNRSEYYALLGSSVEGVVGSSSNTAYTTVVKSPFGVSDLVELLTFRGLNDPSYTSTLESAAGGKYEGAIVANANQVLRYSPLRDNRPLDVERLDVPDGKYTAQRERQIYAHLAADVRHRITTLSGARPIKTGDVPVIQDPVTLQYRLADEQLSDSELKRVTVAAANSSIQAYADGLVPHAADPRAWPSANAADFAKYKYLNYGYRSPEIGLRMAAQMAVNMDAMRGSVSLDGPMLTVPLWDDLKSRTTGLGVDMLANGDLKKWEDRTYKWSSWIYGANRGEISSTLLSRTKADAAGDQLTSDAVNVYGVTPQPFITAAASFSIFTDSKGTGKNDSPPDIADGTAYVDGFPSGAPEVEVKGDRTQGNSDYIADIFAVEIVNPFPAAVTLGEVIQGTPNNTDSNLAAIWLKTRNRFDYYIEYAGRYYRLADWNNGGTPDISSDDGPVKLVLGPAESRVFYFCSLPLEKIEERMRAAQDTAEGALDFPVASDGDKAAVIKRWLKTQLGAVSPGGTPVFVEQFDPTTGDATPVNSGTVVDITSLDATNPTGSTKTVRLWRAHRDTYDDKLGTSNEWVWGNELASDPSTYQNLPKQNLENDVLVDRLRDPEGGSTWKHPVKAGMNKVAGSHGWDWDSDPRDLGNSRNDNRPSGITFTFAGLVNRRGDEEFKLNNLEKTGLLPAYCLESAFGSTALKNTAVKTYEVDGTGNVKFDIKLTRFDNLGGGRIMYKEKSGSAMGSNDSWFDQQAGGTPLFHTMGTAPSQWDTVDEGATGDVLQTGAAKVPQIPQSLIPFNDIRPLLSAKKVAGSVTRPADVLLPLAIGAQFSYRVGDLAPTSETQLEERWMTLSESWALALNYEYNNTLLQTSTRWKVYDKFAEASPTATPPIFPVTDAGRLVIEPSYADPALPSASTQTLNPFIPFVDQNADGQFERVAAGPREDLSMGITPAMAIVDQFTSLPGTPSLQKAQLGTVNIGTAPLAVLRVLPMLSPTSEVNNGGGSVGWWWTAADQSGFNTKLDESVDLAATIAAYRDKGWVRARQNPFGTQGTLVSFDDRDNSGNPLNNLANEALLNGRAGRSDFIGIREQPGFLVASEIMGATRRYQAPGAAAPVPATDRSNIDFLGWDRSTLAAGGTTKINSIQKGVGSLDYSNLDTGTAKNDYEMFEDKLLISNATLGAVSNRSDYFAVWFVVAGFKSTDVRGLSLTTPMVPSVERRYVMVVDRSSVVKRGDRPRIVFFREVPM